MTFEPDPDQRYDMPVAFGPSSAPAVETGFETFTTSITYTTSKDAVARLLPRWFEPADQPCLIVSYTRMINMTWMGGRNYNIVNVSANVQTAAELEPISARYTLAIWESDPAPVLAGREVMGSPKLYAEIPDADVLRPSHRFTCSEYSALLVEAEAHDMVQLSTHELAPIRAAGREAIGLNWKYIPGLDGEPDASYPTALYMSFDYDEAWRGQGSFTFGTPSDTEAPYSAKIVRVLREIPVGDHVSTISLHSPNTTLFRDRTRRLDRPERP